MTRALISAALLAAAALPARASVPEVVTDIPVIHSLVSQVMGELGTPQLLLDQSADAHDFQLRPSQIRALNGADLIIWAGAEMTPWLSRSMSGNSEAQSLDLLHQPGTTIRIYGQPTRHDADGHGDQDHEDDGHGHDHHGADEDAHDHTGMDPHAWLDPDNAALWIGLISDALVAQDPGNAVAYRANATLAQTRIRTLDETLAAELQDAGGAPIIVAHDAYGYFAGHFGLTIAASLAEGDAADPGAAHLSDIRALLEGGDAICIFPEAARDPAPVETLADGTGARIGAPLDPEGRAIAPGPMLYETLLRAMATAIAECQARS